MPVHFAKKTMPSFSVTDCRPISNVFTTDGTVATCSESAVISFCAQVKCKSIRNIWLGHISKTLYLLFCAKVLLSEGYDIQPVF